MMAPPPARLCPGFVSWIYQGVIIFEVVGNPTDVNKSKHM